MPEYSEIKNRRAWIHVGTETLRDMLQLPEGYEIQVVLPSQFGLGMIVNVISPDLDEVPDDVEAPRLDGHWDSALMVDDDGRRYVRWGWSKDEAKHG